MLNRGLFGWSPPHIQPLTPVSEVSEPPESPSPYLDAGADAIPVEDDLVEDGEEYDTSPVAVPFFKLFAYADGLDWLLMLVGTAAAVVHGFALPFYLHLFGKILNFHSQNPNKGVLDDFSKYSLNIIFLAVSVLLAAWIEVSCWIYTAERQCSVIRSKYVRVLLSQEMAFFDTYGSNSDIVSQVTNDVLVIQYTLGEKVGHYIHNMATFIGGLVLGFVNSWQIALVTLSTGPLIVAAGGISNVFLHKLAENVQDAYSEAANVAEQAITCIRTLYASTNETLAKYLYASSLQNTLSYGIQISLVQGVGLGFIYGLAICSCALQLWFGHVLVKKDKGDGGQIVSAAFAIILCGLGLNQAATNFHAFEQSRIAAYRLYDVIDRSSHNHSPDGKTLPSVHGSLELRNVYFSYPSRPDIPILSGLYLSLPARKTMALVGSVGAGKSSIISLILRFYDPTLGEVILDGENIRNLNLEWLRNQIGLVSPEPALLGASIKENILYGRQSSLDDIEEAAKFAHAHTYISSLPNAYETSIEDVDLSDEMKLKLAIARAVLKNPTILLLDEVTSGLDQQAERVVQDALDILVLGRTTMIVAHCLANIRNADIIAVIEEGQLVEMGTHDELISIDGTYAELLQLEETTKPPPRNRSWREQINSQLLRSASPRLMRSSSVSKQNGARFTDFSSAHGSPTQIQSPSSEEKHDTINIEVIERMPSVKYQDGFELTINSLPKLDVRPIQGHIFQSDPESPVSPLLTSDPKNERSHSKTFSRQLVELEGGTRIELDEDKQAEKPSLWRLAKLSAPEWLYALLGSFGAGLFGSFNPLLAFLVMQVADNYYKDQTKHVTNEIGKWCLYITGMGIVTVFVNFLQHFYFGIMGEKMTERVRRMMFSAILRNEVGWFDKEENSAEALSIRLGTDATFVRAAFSNRLSIMIQDTAAVVVTIVVTVIVEWHSAVVAVATIPVLVIAAVAQRLWVMGLSGDIKEAHKKASLVLEEAVRDIYTVVSFSAGSKILDLYKRQLSIIQKNTFISGQIAGLAFGVSQFLLFSSNAFILWYGSQIIKHNGLNADILRAVLCVYAVFSFATFALVEPFGLAPYILKKRDSLQPVFDIIDRKPKFDSDDPEGIKLPNVYGTIELKNVAFSYPTRPEILVLNNFNLKVTGGQTVAIVGLSGSGKSTVISLIERFYDPTAGTVSLDGKNIRTLNLRWLRGHLGLVQQDPVLFSTTIRENIIYAKRNATEAEMKEAARIANAHHFISNLPHGYDTHIGMRGLDLTAGQRQRIAIARVVLRNAQILLLDEASSAVESESSRVVQEALDTLILGNKTTIVIAHRIAMLRRVDTVAVLYDGQIVEEGPHDILMAKCGLYSRLMQAHMSKPMRQHGPGV